MAQLSKTAFETLYGTTGTTFPDNTIGSIGADDVRAFGNDIADSFLNKTDDLEANPISNTGSQTDVLSTFATGAFIKKTEIVTADVLTANASPVNCVAAPDAGYMILPIAYHVGLDYNTVPYATNTTYRFEINGVAVSATNTTTLPGTADRFTIMQAIDVDTTTDLRAQPLVFKVQSGNPTAGNSPITVTVIYRVVFAIGIEP
jgi:hypothetical protein